MTPRTAAWEPYSLRVDVLRGWLGTNGRWPSAVSRNDDERRLGRWVQTQRNRRRDGLLTTDGAAILGAFRAGRGGAASPPPTAPVATRASNSFGPG